MIKLQHLPPRLLVGLSGGADSVALLLLLKETGSQVNAVHVNHGLRGAASDGDEAFVHDLCSRENIPLLTYRADPPENPGEAWAREVRYGFFREAMQISGADALVLAHHQDDQAETLLLHLLRGAGLNGLTGMAADTNIAGIRIMRPLLMYSRAELRAYLNERGQNWREDASNGDSRYLRNALRNDVLPRLEQLIPGAAARMATTASLLAADEAALNTLTDEFLAAYPGDALPLAPLRAYSIGLQKRILRAWWERTAAPVGERSLSAVQTAELLALVENTASARCNLPGGWHGQSGWTHIHLVPSAGTQPITTHPVQGSNMLAIIPCADIPGDGVTCQAVPQEWLASCVIRSRQRGDFIRPFGSDGAQSLQDYFVNRRVDAAFRDRVPLLCRGSEVLLVGGVGAGNVPRWENMNKPVLLRWEQKFPWQRQI